MKGKNKGKTQEKATMSSSKLPIHWCKRESQLIPFNATCLKIMSRGDSRAARDSGFFEEQHCNKSNRPEIQHKNQSFHNFFRYLRKRRLFGNLQSLYTQK